jgi:hypothetical protein
MSDELSFKVVRPNDHDHDEVLARAVNMLIARGLSHPAAGARVIERSKSKSAPAQPGRSAGRESSHSAHQAGAGMLAIIGADKANQRAPGLRPSA